jgi:3'-phosphoadenosine 5'-phosphosulfate sulfotransferase (PAPS reductase)/FAD synthetase
MSSQIKTKHILSFGAGVNSTALLFWLVKNGKPLDEVVFANPMNEMPETYKHIEKIKKWCDERNILFTEVKSHLNKGNLMEWYFERKAIPVRLIRSCTDLFKIRPIYKYLQQKYGKILFNVYIGISLEESHRKKESGRKDRIMLYPLIDAGIDREGCKRIIEQEGFNVPVKSGCYFCPFQSRENWIQLLKRYPELFDNSIKFEENCKRFPEFYLGRNMTLRRLKKAVQEQKGLSMFLKDYGEVERCVYCHL